MKKDIQNLAQICDSISSGIRVAHIVSNNRIISHVNGDIREFERTLLDLKESLLCDYPSIAISLQHHMDCFDNNFVYHKGAIDAIIENIIALEGNGHNKKKIFISHSSKDRDIVVPFINYILRLGIGLESEDIVCTSFEPTTMSNGEDIRKYIKDNIRSADFCLLMISNNYDKSGVCHNELGAAWSTDNNVRYFLLPNTTVDSVGWLGSPHKAEPLYKAETLDSFKDELVGYYQLKDKRKEWSSQRELFLQNIGVRQQT